MQLQIIEKEVGGIVVKPVANAKDMSKAAEMLSQANKYLDSVVEEKEKVTKPLNEALKAERARFKPLEEKLSGLIAELRNAISVYQTAEVLRQRAEESKIANRIGEGKGKLKIETAVAKIDAVEKAETSVATDSGLVKFREDKILKVVDESVVPREYLVLDEKKILADLKAGKNVAGCEIEIIMTPLNYR